MEEDNRQIRLDPELGLTGGKTANIFNDGIKLIGTIDNPYNQGHLYLTKKEGATAVTDEIMERALRIIHSIKESTDKRQGDLMDIDSVRRAIKQQLGNVADQIEIERGA